MYDDNYGGDDDEPECQLPQPPEARSYGLERGEPCRKLSLI